MGIALCFVPLIIAIIIFTLGFKIKVTHQLIACVIGLIAVPPISFIQYFLPAIPVFSFSPVLHAIVKSLLLYGFVEELIKMLVIFPLPHKEYKMLDFLCLSFVLGLALGCFESVVYYFDHLQIANSRGAQLLYGQIALRIFTSDMIHMTCTGLSGLFVFTCRSAELKTKVSFFIVAVVLHGIYDFFAGFSGSIKWFSAVVVLLAIAECRIKYVSLQKSDK